MTGSVFEPLVRSAEELDLYNAVSDFLDSQQPPAVRRSVIASEGGHDADLWRRAAKDLGLLEIAVPREYGGAGGGHASVALVLEAAGHANTSWPFLSCVLAAYAIILAGNDREAERWLPAIAAGETIGTVGVRGDAGGWGAGVTAVQSGPGQWALAGRVSFVPDALIADTAVVAATTDTGLALFYVDLNEDGVTRTPLDSVDLTRRLGRLDFDGARASCLTRDGADALDAFAVVSSAALVAEQVGGMRAAVRRSTEYANTRIQFGRKIGSFQVIKHRCADMYIRADCARAIGHALSFKIDAALASPRGLLNTALGHDVALAFAFCGPGYVSSVRDMMQVHGGIGFTWEHDTHLYLRRALADLSLFRTINAHWQQLADEVRANGLVSAISAAGEK